MLILTNSHKEIALLIYQERVKVILSVLANILKLFTILIKTLFTETRFAEVTNNTLKIATCSDVTLPNMSCASSGTHCID